ncbi:alpha-L-glutamate ligase [Corallococcus coralloides]|uniref:Alpha-L-glutamate ligase n=1 Tax=Corallococcus coralloides TaxID=184914 RepID=A0A410RMQ0_CORCK|nr:hypothetical protein [Corallococcus coralloides]QAT83247.1 alpha-L-glutamate ligase [Corallococcus coralloides]
MDFAADDCAVVEPFIDYERDVRCLAVGERMWAMTRASAGWRANVDTRKYHVIDPPPELAEHTRRAMRHLGADVLGLDFLQAKDGAYTLLECNDTPGLSGFPEELREDVAECLRVRMRQR